ncbi:hypothetical protein IJD44_09690 [bacterium]|nr:hypothetical protein [bacterium]
MKKLIATIFCILMMLSIVGCIWFKEESSLLDTKVKRITHNFSVNENQVYFGFWTDHYSDENWQMSTFVIDVEKKDIISRIVYSENKGESMAILVKPFDGKLWLLGAEMSKKILVFNPETGKTESVIEYEEANHHTFNILPSMNKALVMHGYHYEEGCSVSVIDLKTKKYEGIVYVDELAPIIQEYNGIAYGCGNGYLYDESKEGFGTYELKSKRLEFKPEIYCKPQSESPRERERSTFLILPDKSFVVRDRDYGITIRNPDGNLQHIYARGYKSENYDLGDIFFSEKLDRIFVYAGLDHNYAYLERNTQNEWNWNDEHFLDFDEESISNTYFKNDVILVSIHDRDSKQYVVKFYDAETFNLVKEVRWNLFTDEKTIIEK